MTKIVIQQAIDSLKFLGHSDASEVVAALKAELDKPEPEIYGYVSEHRWLIGDNSHEFHFKLETIYQNNCTSITPVYTKGTTNV